VPDSRGVDVTGRSAKTPVVQHSNEKAKSSAKPQGSRGEGVAWKVFFFFAFTEQRSKIPCNLKGNVLAVEYLNKNQWYQHQYRM